MALLRNYGITFGVLKKVNPNYWVYRPRIQKYSDAPVKYSVSKAAEWKAEFTRRGTPEDVPPWFQPYVVTGSIAIFLLYFCVLREENDLDELLDTSLYDRIEGLELSQLRTSLKYYEESGKDVSKIKERLQVLEGKCN